MEIANVTYQDESGTIKVKADHNKCITCGRCVISCRHNARMYEDDTERFFADLAAGIPVSLIAAPSIRSNIPQYKRLFAYLKKIGVTRIYDVSLGADICVWAHIKYIKQGGRPHLITQPCPAIVSYCEIYKHDLLKNLSPIHSPMACIAIYMKNYEHVKEPIAALSPCIAKSNEFEATGLAEYNVTYTKMQEYLDTNNIVLPEEEADFDHYESGPGSLFPMPGGFRENIEFYFGGQVQVSQAEGFSVYKKLETYLETSKEILPEIFDVLNCVEGCNIGPAAIHDRNIFEIDWTMKKSRETALNSRTREYFDSLFSKYDDKFTFSHFIREYRPVEITYPEVTDKDIEEAFRQLGKDTDEKQNIDCHACGNESCYQMARRIALKVNIPINCIVNAMETAKAEHKQMVLSEHASKAKSEFLSSMSHEMRTPMNAIIGMTQIAAKTSDVDKLKYCLSNIGNSSAHLLGIINDVLDMSKIEAGKLELENAPMSIESVLMRACYLVTEKMEQKNIAFNIVLNINTRAHYIGDELKLSQVLTNLLSNAVKFTPEGGRIALSAIEIPDADSDYSVFRFSVKDSGIGMTDEQKSRLFIAYQQADSSTTRKFGGTGLGLAISKSIVEMMNGSIHLESEPGKGSEFTIEVKLRHRKEEREEDVSGDINPAQLKTLVAVPDPEARKYIKSIISSLGVKSTDETENIGEAVDLAIREKEAGKPYDIIYIDYNAADETTIAAVSKSRFEMIANSVVVMTTFLNWNKIGAILHDSGIRRFIPKPVFPSVILNSIKEISGGVSKKPDATQDNTREPPDLSNIKLLLVDDVEINRDIFIALLEDTKADIDVAENGLIAVQKFRENPDDYDIIIMDMQMPEMDGLEASRTIRALDHSKAKTIPIVAMSANVFKDDIDACISSGMNDHLAKPIELEAVLDTIAKYCGGE